MGCCDKVLEMRSHLHVLYPVVPSGVQTEYRSLIFFEKLFRNKVDHFELSFEVVKKLLVTLVVTDPVC